MKVQWNWSARTLKIHKNWKFCMFKTAENKNWTILEIKFFKIVKIEKLTILWGQNRNLQCLKYAKNSYQYWTSSKLIRFPFNFGQNEHLERNVYIMDTVNALISSNSTICPNCHMKWSTNCLCRKMKNRNLAQFL